MKEMKLNIQLFSHTNETTNYDLPQFIGTDKPTWLGDFNTAMSTIDTAVGTNASAITSLGTRVTSAEGVASQASTDVASLTSTVSTLSSNVSSATTTANNAQSTATSALNTANSADGKADTNASAISALDTRVDACESNISNINLTNFVNYSSPSDFTKVSGTGTLSYCNLTIASNSDASLGKVYGYLDFTGLSSNCEFTIPSPFDVDETFTISGTGRQYQFTVSSGVWQIRNVILSNIRINSDNTITIVVNKNANADRCKIFLDACLLFIKDFGDTSSNSGE